VFLIIQNKDLFHVVWFGELRIKSDAVPDSTVYRSVGLLGLHIQNDDGYKLSVGVAGDMGSLIKETLGSDCWLKVVYTHGGAFILLDIE
jgi:hypothetical protein